VNENSLYLTLKDGEKALPDLLRLLDGSNLPVQSVTLARPSLDDVFLKYTGRSMREDGEKQ
jgi:ABC-2 type transport system ATP-binding protein